MGSGEEVVPFGLVRRRFDSMTRKRQRMGRFGYGYGHERRCPEGLCGQGSRSGVSRRRRQVGDCAGGHRAGFAAVGFRAALAHLYQTQVNTAITSAGDSVTNMFKSVTSGAVKESK